MRIESKTEIVENYNGWKGEELIRERGASYVPGRDVKEIAKDVRGLVKSAVKAGFLPKSLKASVRIDRYSMGCSLDVDVTAVDDCILNVSAWREQAANGYRLSWADLGGMYNTLGREVLDTLVRFCKAFQKSESHSQSDYHNTNFYLDVNFSGDVIDQQKSVFVEVGCEG